MQGSLDAKELTLGYPLGMKTTATFAIFSACLVGFLTAGAAPKSSVPFEKALKDAEMLASTNSAWTVHRTAGKAMGGFFGDNSLILVQEASLSDIRVGMMLVYRSTSGKLISDKVVSLNSNSVETMGVANLKATVTVTPDMIEGIVFGVFHTAGLPAGPVYASNGSVLPTTLWKNY